MVTYKNISPQDYLIDISDVDWLDQSIERVLSQPDDLMAKIELFIKNTNPYLDGQSSERVLNAIDGFLSGEVPIKRRPFDFFRQFKMRKKLNYWKIW